MAKAANEGLAGVGGGAICESEATKKLQRLANNEKYTHISIFWMSALAHTHTCIQRETQTGTHPHTRKPTHTHIYICTLATFPHPFHARDAAEASGAIVVLVTVQLLAIFR